MGWTNSVPIFHDNLTYILQPKIPDTTVPYSGLKNPCSPLYIDNVPICGLATHYTQPNGSKKQIPENPGIPCLTWEQFQGLNRVVQRICFRGGTFSGFKSLLCTEEIIAVRHRCTPQG